MKFKAFYKFFMIFSLAFFSGVVFSKSASKYQELGRDLPLKLIIKGPENLPPKGFSKTCPDCCSVYDYRFGQHRCKKSSFKDPSSGSGSLFGVNQAFPWVN